MWYAWIEQICPKSRRRVNCHSPKLSLTLTEWKGTSGAAKNYISRTQAVRKLQISLPDFRRLCIFKGIYPREPRAKKKVSKSSTPSTTFYYNRDIQYLLHEPLLATFRDHKSLSKKIARHLAKGEVGDAQRLEKQGSKKLSLDHLVKERYPTFVDALRDLDDPLNLLFLFANLPSSPTVSPKTIALCQRLCHEFEHYLIISNSLRKSFLSIKGIYYQATIQGQDILWLVPYKFVQRPDPSVDFRIMGTFVEFYTTLLGFVNFRLYTSIGLVYPPKFNAKTDERGGELSAFMLEGRAIEGSEQGHTLVNGKVDEQAQPNEHIQKLVATIRNNPAEDEDPGQNQGVTEENDTLDTFEPIGKDADILPQPQASSNDIASLFTPFTFFLSRETPRHPLEFILRAFGCKRIAWDAVLGDGAFTNNESDPTITHQVVDRPPLANPPEAQVSNGSSEVQSSQVVKAGYRVPGRIYVQPQWVWDCINEVKLLRPDLYAPGVIMPPHLSPWVKPKKGAYDPSVSLAEQEREGEAEEAEGLDGEEDENSDEESDVDGSEEEGAALPSKSSPSTKDLLNGNDMDIAPSDSDSDPSSASVASSFAGFDDPSDTETAPTLSLHQRELEAEASGIAFTSENNEPADQKTSPNGNKPQVKGILKVSSGSSKAVGEEARKRAAKKRREEEEELERRKMMLGRKKRKLVDKMLYSNRKGEEEAARLRGKRRKIESGKAKR